MHRGIRWAGLVVLLAFVLPAIGADEKKSDKKPAADPKTEKKAPEKNKYIAFGQPLVSTIVSVDDKTVKFVAKVPIYRAGRIVGANEQEMELEAADDVKVRIEVLPIKVDEDGKKIKRTAEEMKELKGKEGLWGYAGTMENLQPGRIVRVYRSKVKGADKEDPPVITMIHVAKMPGDEKVEVVGSGTGGGEGKKPAAEGSDELVPFGQPFVAMYARTENDSTIHLIRRIPAFVGGKVEYKDINGSFEAADELKIRIEMPPPQLDDNGKIKKLTKDELKELKGDDDKEWGFAGNVENLQPGRMVKVFLAKAKGADKTDPPVITTLHVMKDPTDLRVDPEELVFIEKKKPGAKKDDEKKDDEKKDDEKKKKEDEDKPPPYGRPFIGTITKNDNGRVGVNIKERFLNGTKVEFRDKNVEFSCYEAVRVRIQEPALTFDDKGGIKKYTAEELKELKGKEELWGYPADLEAVQPGRRVKVFLGRFPDDKKEAPVILQIFVAKPPKVAE